MTTTLLAVDDSKTMRKVLEITFAGEEEYRAVLADSAEDAFTKLQAEKPGIVLIDAALRGTSGYDLCQKIKADLPATGVILLSSKQQPYERGRGTSAGVDDFIDKPFDTQQLIEKVGTVLKQAVAAPAPQQPAQPAVRPAAPPVTQAGPSGPTLGEPRPRVQTLAYGAAAQKTGPSPAKPAAQTAPVAARSASPTQGGMGATAAPLAPSARPVVASPPKPVGAPAQPEPAPVVAEPAQPIHSAEKPAAVSVGLEGKLQDLGLTSEQVQGVLAISKEVLEQAVWEVVPVLAETMIREEIERLTKD